MFRALAAAPVFEGHPWLEGLAGWLRVQPAKVVVVLVGGASGRVIRIVADEYTPVQRLLLDP